MGCTSSKFVPWAGRNEITQAASSRKKAAKEVLASYRAFSGCHASQIASLKIMGQSLGVFLDEEDKGMDPSANSHAEGQKQQEEVPVSTYEASWSKTPGLFDKEKTKLSKDVDVDIEVEYDVDGSPPEVSDVEEEEEEAAMEEEEEEEEEEEAAMEDASQASLGFADLGMPKLEKPKVKKLKKKIPKETQKTVLEPNPTPPQLNSSTALALVPVGGGPQPIGGGLRGGGLSELSATINALLAEAEVASRQVTDSLACGIPKKYTALPPLPAPPQPGQPMYGGQLAARQSLWEVLEILVAYETARNKETKNLEKAKWEHNKSSGKLSRQSKKTVKAEKAEKHQKRINSTHAKVQSVQNTITRLSQTVEGHTLAIENIKANLLLPAVKALLPAFLQMHVQLATIYDKQKQAVDQVIANGRLQNLHVTGPRVLFTQQSHHIDTEALESALTKLEQSLGATITSQKKFLTSTTAWLKKVDPTSIAVASVPFNPTPSGYPNPGNSQQPIVTQPSDFPSNGSVAPGPNPQSIGHFLDGSTSGGEPLLAICNDWLRSMEKLPEQAVKDGILLYLSWVRECLTRQASEKKQAKKVEDLQKQVAKAEQKYESLLKKEREFRSTLEKPYEGPMSRSLTASTQGSPLRLADASSTPSSQTEGPTPVKDVDANSSLGAIQLYQSPQSIPMVSQAEVDAPVDKAGAKAMAKEQAKEVKAFSMAKDVDLAKGVLEGLKVKTREEQASLEAMALDSRVTATDGVQQALGGVFAAMAGYSAVASQMYGMLQAHHAKVA